MAGVFEVVGRVAHILPKSEQHGAGMGVEIKTLSAGQDERFDEYRSMVEKALFKMK
jgi:hypothetical protein